MPWDTICWGSQKTPETPEFSIQACASACAWGCGGRCEESVALRLCFSILGIPEIFKDRPSLPHAMLESMGGHAGYVYVTRVFASPGSSLLGEMTWFDPRSWFHVIHVSWTLRLIVLIVDGFGLLWEEWEVQKKNAWAHQSAKGFWCQENSFRLKRRGKKWQHLVVYSLFGAPEASASSCNNRLFSQNDRHFLALSFPSFFWEFKYLWRY